MSVLQIVFGGGKVKGGYGGGVAAICGQSYLEGAEKLLQSQT
jgi:hypothetical protein